MDLHTGLTLLLKELIKQEYSNGTDDSAERLEWTLQNLNIWTETNHINMEGLAIQLWDDMMDSKGL